MAEIPPMKCVSCGELNTNSSSLSDPKLLPEPGNIGLCLYCGHVSVVGDDLRLREMTDQEAYEIAGDPMLLEAQKFRTMFLEALKKEKKRKEGK